MTFRQTATALGKLGHPNGELNLTRAAAKHGIIQMVLRHHVSISAVTTDRVNLRYLLYRRVPLTNWSMPLKQIKCNFSSCTWPITVL